MRIIHATISAAIVAAVAVAAVTLRAAPRADRNDDRNGPDKYTIGLFGDMPYNALGRSEYPALLADINASHVAFSIFDGDLKAAGDATALRRCRTSTRSGVSRPNARCSRPPTRVLDSSRSR
jgi:hypothetical protein